MKVKIKLLAVVAAMLVLSTSCENDEPEPVFDLDGRFIEDANPNGGNVEAFYVLCEGNMGSNTCTLDRFTYKTRIYARNIYPAVNPTQVLELGDVGNDIAIKDHRMYIVVNGSNKVEVLDAATAIRIGQVDIPSPRNIVFDKDHAYVSSFVGGEGEKGSVVRFNIDDLKVDGIVSVGLQPEEMAINSGKLYVANSGQFQAPDYDGTISVVDLSTFKFDHAIKADINLHHLRIANDGTMWVTSRGNYADKPSCLQAYVKKDGEYAYDRTVVSPCDNIALFQNKIYYYGTTYDASWTPTYTYGTVVDGVPGGSFIDSNWEKMIESPYCIAVQPSTGDIFVTDAKNYTSSGVLRCFSPDGQFQWYAMTGNIPGHIAFLMKK